MAAMQALVGSVPQTRSLETARMSLGILVNRVFTQGEVPVTIGLGRNRFFAFR